jgi:hypothetical protein
MTEILQRNDVCRVGDGGYGGDLIGTPKALNDIVVKGDHASPIRTKAAAFGSPPQAAMLVMPIMRKAGSAR